MCACILEWSVILVGIIVRRETQPRFSVYETACSCSLTVSWPAHGKPSQLPSVLLESAWHIRVIIHIHYEYVLQSILFLFLWGFEICSLNAIDKKYIAPLGLV